MGRRSPRLRRIALVTLLLGASALVSPIAARADSFVPSPVTGGGSVVLDPARDRMYVGAYGSVSIDTLAGVQLTSIPTSTGYGGGPLTLSADGSDLYVPAGAAIDIIDTASMTISKSLAIPYQPANFAVQNGRLWYVSQGCNPDVYWSQIGSVSLADPTDSSWTDLGFSGCPKLIPSPTDPNIIFVISRRDGEVDKLDVSTETPAILATKPVCGAYTGCVSTGAISADGSRLLIDMHDVGIEVLDTADLSVAGTYDLAWEPDAILISPDGSHVFAENSVHSASFPWSVNTPNASWSFGAADPAYSADGTTIYGLGTELDNVDRSLESSSIDVSVSPTVDVAAGDPVTISGVLSVSGGADVSNQTIHVFLNSIGASNWETTEVATVVTDSTGRFSLDTVAPDNADFFGATWMAFWAGDPLHAGAMGRIGLQTKKWYSSVTIQATPDHHEAMDTVSVSGTLSLADGGDASGRTLTLAIGQTLPTRQIMTGSGGVFSATYKRPGPGDYDDSYFVNVTFHATARYQESYASQEMWTHMAPTKLSLSFDPGPVPYHHASTLTAHLSDFLDGRGVTIYQQPSGGDKTLLTEGNVNTSGDLSVRVTPEITTKYFATYDGDSRYGPAEDSRTLKVDVLLTATMIKAQGHVGSVAIYKPPHAVLCSFSIKPDRPGGTIDVHLETKTASGWKEITQSGFKIPRSGPLVVGLPAAALRSGVPYRIWGGFEADKEFGPTHSKPAYFRVA